MTNSRVSRDEVLPLHNLLLVAPFFHLTSGRYGTSSLYVGQTRMQTLGVQSLKVYRKRKCSNSSEKSLTMKTHRGILTL